MFTKSIASTVAVAALFTTSFSAASAQPTTPGPHTPSPSMSGGAIPNAASGDAMNTGAMSGPDHGMPAMLQGGDGAIYSGEPDLDAAISLVTVGGGPGKFSIAKALDNLAGPATAKAEEAKLTKQYGAASFGSFVAVQNFAVDDAVKKALAAGVKFPSPTLSGAPLAKRVVTLGLIDGTYYEGYQLDHLVTNKIHEAVMDDIDQQYGAAADANYHKIADQAHYDLAQALGATTVKLAPFH